MDASLIRSVIIGLMPERDYRKNNMKHPNKKGAGVPLQFGGKSGRPSVEVPPRGMDADATPTTAPPGQVYQAFVHDLIEAPPEDFKTVAKLAEGVAAFSAQLGEFQRGASLAIIGICLPLLCVYAYFAVLSI